MLLLINISQAKSAGVVIAHESVHMKTTEDH
jgi:hypothetical protein